MTERNVADDTKRVSDDCPVLFHYTTVPAFENIYKSRTFWATHHEDLNDESELRRFRLKVIGFVAPIIRKIFDKHIQCDPRLAKQVNRRGGIDAVVHQEAAQQLNALHGGAFGERGFRETFICSFCAHDAQTYEVEHGLLSQWRGYVTGGGVAIVLDTSGIEERMQHEKDVFSHPMNHIGDVKYDHDDTGIQKAFCDVFEFFPEILSAPAATQTPPPVATPNSPT